MSKAPSVSRVSSLLNASRSERLLYSDQFGSSISVDMADFAVVSKPLTAPELCNGIEHLCYNHAGTILLRQRYFKTTSHGRAIDVQPVTISGEIWMTNSENFFWFGVALIHSHRLNTGIPTMVETV